MTQPYAGRYAPLTPPPRRLRHLAALVAIWCCLSPLSVVATEIDWDHAAAEARSLHSKARSQGDLWTCLQLEALATAHPESRLRFNSYLGRSEVIGDARFAFPHSIRQHWDRHDFIGVVSGERFYRLDPHGRPLQTSIATPFSPNRSNLNRAGTLLAIADSNQPRPERRVQLAVLNANDGSLLWQRDVPIPNIPQDQDDFVHGNIAVAEDGSAVAVALNRRPDAHHRLLVSTREGPRAHPNLTNPQGIGSNAAWLIAHRNRQQVLITAQGPRDISDHAIGPGIAMVLDGDNLLLVGADGNVTPYQAHIGMGRRPGVWSLGNWLVIGSGDGATQPERTDLFGNVVAGGDDQPYTLALHRWSDLLEDPTSAPVTTITNRYSRADFLPRTLYLWQDAEISLLDLNGEDPLIIPWVRGELPVHWVENSHHFTVAQHPENLRSLYANDGGELWHGEADATWVQSHSRLLYRQAGNEGPTYTVVEVHNDPLQRREVPLALPPGHWRIRVHQWKNFGTADSDEAWHRFRVDNGQLTESVVKNPLVETPNVPWWRGEDNSHGRFITFGGRLFRKTEGFATPPAAQSLVPQDAYYAGPAMFILDESEAVYLLGRRGFEEMGRVAADVIVTDSSGQNLFLGRGWQRTIVARLERGPRLVTDLGPNPGQGQNLPDQPWSFGRNDRFTPPRSPELQWDQERAGFSPRRLRSGGPQNLIVMTHSLILVLEPRALPLVSRRR